MFFLLFFLCMPFAIWMVAAMFWAVFSHIIVPLVVIAVVLLAVWLIVRWVKR